ncbi:hypothetical protein F4859DRAFT_489421 [Xylaria cf. heliscus]|nr:hypothetical protein F4859DRAFT_489421 [Xylaria cf. heliscus]
MYISKLLLPAMLALRGLAQATASSDEGALEARETDKLSTLARDSSDPQQGSDPSSMQSDAVAELVAEDAEDDPQDQELSARDTGTLERRRWCRQGNRWHRHCRRPLPRPWCPRDQRPYCIRGRWRREAVPYDPYNPWCWRNHGHRVFCFRSDRDRGPGTVIIIPGGYGYDGDE